MTVSVRETKHTGERAPDLRRLIGEHQGAVYNYVCRMLHHEADAADVTQEVFAAALACLERYDPERELRPWILGIATRRVLRFLRDRKRQLQRERRAAMPQFVVTGFEKELEKREVQMMVQEHVRALPAETRSLLILRFYNGLTQNEVAQALQLPRSTVRDRIRQALGELKSKLSSSGNLAVLPQLQALMEATAPIPVPSSVSASLFSLSGMSTLGSMAGPSGAIIGGIMLSMKTLVITGMLIAVLSLSGGVGIAHVVHSKRAKQEDQQQQAVERKLMD